MFTFFLPASKVQKDRRIMRETDARMAKYSRRGLVFNFLAFLICLSTGKFVEEDPRLMLILTAGLFLLTVLRGIYLLRFDHMYPRAPARWRNRYFVITLLGAIWWSVIMVTVTLKLEMQYEAPYLWFYTVIFFSITAHAFAPYQKFLTLYQFLGQIPAVGAAFYLNYFDGYLYGTLMLGFFVVLTHQCRLMSENYWERLEATYALARKTVSFEEEKRDTRANARLNLEFIEHLNYDLDRFMEHLQAKREQEIKTYRHGVETELNELHRNICDFNGVLSKSLLLKQVVFNIRHEIQHLVAEFVDTAEGKEIQVETSLSPTLPMRLKGDASRLAQIIRTLLQIILDDAEKCIVLVEVEFLREYETAGELYVSVTRYYEKSRRLFFTENKDRAPQATLSFIVAKGLADLMNGSIEISEANEDYQQFRFNAKIDIAERAGHLDFHKDSFAGRNVLLLHPHPRIVDLKRQELDALGFNVFTETQNRRAIQTLLNSYKFQNPIQSLVFYLQSDTDETVSFCKSVIEAADLKYTTKIAAATRQQQDAMRELGYDEENGFYYVDKPTGLFEVESIFYQIYKQDEDDDQAVKAARLRIGLVLDDVEALSPVGNKIEQLGEELLLLGLEFSLGNQEDDKLDMIIIDCDVVEDIASVVEMIRNQESVGGADFYMPVIGLSHGKEGLEDTIYETGLDDYIDLARCSNKALKSRIYYWSTLQ